MANQSQVQTQGIQQLLAAEKKAADKVNGARRRKAKRLRQAKEEAEDEIEKFRKERDQQYQEFLNHGGKEALEKDIEIDTNRKLEELNRATATHLDEVVTGVLDIIQDIKPIIHKNFRNVA